MNMIKRFHAPHKTWILTTLLVAMLISSCFTYSPFGGIVSFAIGASDVVVDNETELREAVNNASFRGSTTIALNKDITLTDTALTIPANKDIILTSNKATGYYKLIGADEREVISIERGGALRLEGIIVTHVSGNYGNGVHIEYGGSFYLCSGKISDNIADSGTGVSNNGVFVMSGGEISGNIAYDGVGGGVANTGTFTMLGGEITNNKATRDGGGVNSGGVNRYGYFVMFGGKIYDNTASSNGGGVYIGYPGVFNMSGGEITGNTANRWGGGVYVLHPSTVELLGGVISGNTAEEYNDMYPDNIGQGSSTNLEDKTGLTAKESWTTKAAMSEPRWDMGVVNVNGKIYVIGGRPATPGFYSDNVGTNEVYDPKTDKWTTLASMPTPRESFTIFEYQNKIYCIGGVVRVADYGGFEMVGVDVTEVYDIASDKWSTMSTSFNVGGGTYVVNGQIFVLSYNQLYKYDVVADSWTNQRLPDGLFPFIFGAVVLDEKIFFIYLKSNVVYEYGNEFALSVYIYDAKTDKWSEGTTGFMGAYGLVVGTTVGIYAPQKIYVFGRHRETGPSWSESESFGTGTYVYDPVIGVWSTAMAPSASLEYLEHCHVVNVDDVLYVIGGSINEQYIPLGYHGTVGSELSDANSSFLTYKQVIVAIVLIVGVVVAGLWVYFRKRKTDSEISPR